MEDTGWRRNKYGGLFNINAYMNDKIKKQYNKDYMWHGSTEENIENIKDYGFREDKTAYFATNHEIVDKNYGTNKIMLRENDFKLKDVTNEVRENVFPTDNMRKQAINSGYDGIKYKTSQSNYDVEILNHNKLNQVINKTEKENLELTLALGGNLTDKEKRRYEKLNKRS